MNWFNKKELKIGQVWAMKDSDPFHKSEFVDEIIDLKDGYVLVQPHIAEWLREKMDNTKDMKDWPDPTEQTYKESDFRWLNPILIKDVG
jgi:hypothetical protein